MNLARQLRTALIEKILADPSLPCTSEQCARITLDLPPPDKAGDLASNAALVLAASARMQPMALAVRLAPMLASEPFVDHTDIVAPGFLNVFLSSEARRAVLKAILTEQQNYGRVTQRQPSLVNVEYVSANPTGPLHIAHARGAVLGDVIATLLENVGYRVLREYYVNDRGEQIHRLARSLHWRYCALFDEQQQEEAAVPEGLYPGAYLREIARALRRRDRDRWLEAEESLWLDPLARFACAHLLAGIKADLLALGVDFGDNFVSERQLIEGGEVEASIARLQAQGAVRIGSLPAPKKIALASSPLPPRDALQHLLFTAKRFGDDEDRVLKTAEGKWTYFAVDIAYHESKYRRGAARAVDVLGADHIGHARRLKAALTAFAAPQPPPAFDVIACQTVRLQVRGQPLKMSKRGGVFVEMKDLIERVGRDATRFLMLTRKAEAPLDFDIEAAVAKTHDNPVFYVQYAHARCCSLARVLAEKQTRDASWNAVSSSCESLLCADAALLTQQHECALLRRIALFPRVLESAATALEPHRLVFYLIDCAADFHAWWNAGNRQPALRALTDNPPLAQARLALARATQIVIASGLRLCGVSAPTEMT